MSFRIRVTSSTPQQVEERRKLKPQPGDTVRHMGSAIDYVVVAVGTKAVRVYEKNGNKDFTKLLMLNEVGKVISDDPTTEFSS